MNTIPKFVQVDRTHQALVDTVMKPLERQYMSLECKTELLIDATQTSLSFIGSWGTICVLLSGHSRVTVELNGHQRYDITLLAGLIVIELYMLLSDCVGNLMKGRNK